MGHPNIQFKSQMIDLQADQGHHNHLHLEPCIVYTNLPNYPHQIMNFHPIPECLENPIFYSMPPYNVVRPQLNLDLNVPPPSNHYNNPYSTRTPGIIDFPVQVHPDGAHDLSHVPFKRKMFAEGTSSSASFMPLRDETSTMVDIGSFRSVMNMDGVVGPDSVWYDANVIQGGYVLPPVHFSGNHPWLDMNIRADNGDMGDSAWGQSLPNLTYLHVLVIPILIPQGPPMDALIGYNVNHPPQMPMPSLGFPIIRYSNASLDHFQDVSDVGSAFIAPVPHTGFQMYRPHRGEIMYDTNARERDLPRLRFFPEDEVAIFEIPGYRVAGESIDHHIDLRLDIDHMSYEELLTLGEQMGNVGTGLSEEYIQNNLSIRSFNSGLGCIDLEVAPLPDQEMVNFCVVCQMDYEYEESIGMLDCGHEYHKECIKKWLVVKNTCPVCKSTALRGTVKAVDVKLKI